MIERGTVVGNEPLCLEHFRLTVRVGEFTSCNPGQFVHIAPDACAPTPVPTVDESSQELHNGWSNACHMPLLRRAFSIAGLRRDEDGAEIDILYRVVGTGTRWMASLGVGDSLSVLGPLGNAFPIHPEKKHVYLVAGGVGLPPMLWLAERLKAAGRSTVAFCGARSFDLLALSFNDSKPPSANAESAVSSCAEFSKNDTDVVISTDDGSFGYCGHVGDALTAYTAANPVPASDLVIYTCGPERMMRFVANFCEAPATGQSGSAGGTIECYVCMERAMACGTGLCQSCVVAVKDETDAEGWVYQLCCTQGPVFASSIVLWETPIVHK